MKKICALIVCMTVCGAERGGGLAAVVGSTFCVGLKEADMT
jgi:hypothetical protein